MRIADILSEVIDIDRGFPIDEYRYDPGSESWIAYALDADDREIKITLDPLGFTNDHLYVQFKRDEQFGVTGWGDAGRVFATVLKAVKIYLSEHAKPRVILLLAQEPQRQKLYKRIVDKYAGKFGYKLDSITDGQFRLVRDRTLDK